MKFTEIVHNPHVNHLAALLAVSMAPGWRMNHPEVPSVRAKIEELFKLLKGIEQPMIKAQFVTEFSQLLLRLKSADEKLFYRQEDLDWLNKVLDDKDYSQSKMIISFIFALSSTRQDWYTAEQLSELTGEGASTWRKRAVNIIGAKQAGKTWIFPVLSLRAYGVDVPVPMTFEVEHEESNESEE